MLSVLLAASLLFSQTPEIAPSEPVKPIQPIVKCKHTVAVPDEETKPAAEDATKPKVVPKAAPKPAPKKAPPTQAPTEEQRKVKVVSAMYDLSSGQVRILATATEGGNPTYH